VDGGALDGGALDGGALDGGALDGGALDAAGIDDPGADDAAPDAARGASAVHALSPTTAADRSTPMRARRRPVIACGRSRPCSWSPVLSPASGTLAR
jgi:hypothetical protein